jgi:hypothetical protein
MGVRSVHELRGFNDAIDMKRKAPFIAAARRRTPCVIAADRSQYSPARAVARSPAAALALRLYVL